MDTVYIWHLVFDLVTPCKYTENSAEAIFESDLIITLPQANLESEPMGRCKGGGGAYEMLYEQ